MSLSQIVRPKFGMSHEEELCQNYLNTVYAHIQATQSKAQCITETNGEILPLSINKLISLVALSDNDVFVDLGAGAGKVVTQVFLTTQVKKALGIEIRPDLHHQAVAAATRIREELPMFYQPNRSLDFLLGSMFDISFSDATVLWVNSVCFSPDMLIRLGKIINASPHIHTVLALRPLPGLKKLSFKRSIRVECSWDTALCYLYHSG